MEFLRKIFLFTQKNDGKTNLENLYRPVNRTDPKINEYQKTVIQKILYDMRFIK